MYKRNLFITDTNTQHTEQAPTVQIHTCYAPIYWAFRLAACANHYVSHTDIWQVNNILIPVSVYTSKYKWCTLQWNTSLWGTRGAHVLLTSRREALWQQGGFRCIASCFLSHTRSTDRDDLVNKRLLSHLLNWKAYSKHSFKEKLCSLSSWYLPISPF